METIKKLYRWRRARKGVRAIGAAYKAGDFDNVSYGVLEKYGIADMSESSLGERMFIFSHRLVPINKEKLDKANALARATNDPDAPQTLDPKALNHPTPPKKDQTHE